MALSTPTPSNKPLSSSPPSSAPLQPSPTPPGSMHLFFDCDNTLCLTEETAFAATSQTINTFLSDFKIPRSRESVAADELSDEGNERMKECAAQQQDSSSDENDDILQVAHIHPTAQPAQPPPSSLEDSDSDSSDSEDEPPYESHTTSTLLASYIGLPFRQILHHLASKHSIALTPAQIKHYTLLEEANVNTYISLHSPAADGVVAALTSLRASGRYGRMVVVSSSPLPRVRAALAKAALYPSFFGDGDLFSASDSLAVPLHKPHPAIYQHTLATLGVAAEQCISVEDSVSGCLSSVAAGVRCIGYVGGYHDGFKAEAMGRVLRSKGASEVVDHWDEIAAAVGRVERMGIGEGERGGVEKMGRMCVA